MFHENTHNTPIQTLLHLCKNKNNNFIPNKYTDIKSHKMYFYTKHVSSCFGSKKSHLQGKLYNKFLLRQGRMVVTNIDENNGVYFK